MQPTDNYEFYRWNIEKLGFLWWLHSWKNMSFDSVVWLWYNKDMKLLLKISIYHPHKCIMNKSCLNLPSAKCRQRYRWISKRCWVYSKELNIFSVLENRWRASVRGFESHSLLHLKLHMEFACKYFCLAA